MSFGRVPEVQVFSPAESARMGFRPKEHLLVRISASDDILDHVTMKLSLLSGGMVFSAVVDTSLEGVLMEITRENGPRASVVDHLIYFKNILMRKKPKVTSFKLN